MITKVLSLETGPSLVGTFNKRAITDDQEKMLRFHGKDRGCAEMSLLLKIIRTTTRWLGIQILQHYTISVIPLGFSPPSGKDH
jgi:hypothetical protein